MLKVYKWKLYRILPLIFIFIKRFVEDPPTEGEVIRALFLCK